MDKPARIQYTIQPVEVAVVSTSSPTLSVKSAFKIENKSVHAVFLTVFIFLKKQQTHGFVVQKMLISCP